MPSPVSRLSASVRRSLVLASALLCAAAPLASPAQSPEAQTKAPDYTSIVIFGDSLSDTGNVAHLTQAKYDLRIPGPVADYTDGRFTDGADTYAPAQKYFGVWVEQLAASFPSKPKIKDSLDGGTDYAYGFATTAGGTAAFTFGPGDELSVQVDNIGKQITDYLATHPKITDKTLFIVWGGAIDLLYATSEDDILEAGIRQTVNIERLVDAGATQFIIPNLPPLGLTPRLNGSPVTSVPANAASALYNQTLASGVSIVREIHPFKPLVLLQLDVFSLFESIVAKPSKFAFANITTPSQDEPVDPDTYLFWDDLHPTTHGHNLLAAAAEALIVAKKAGGTTESGRAGLADLRQTIPAE
jgi:phospholipase/lecithinase/hemolysin